MAIKLSKIQDEYYMRSGKASDVARQLAFAGVAIIWIFRISGTNTIPEIFYIPLLIFAVGFAIDLLQYFYSSFVFGVVVIWGEIYKMKMDTELSIPPFFSWITTILFVIKIVALVIGYVYLINNIYHSFIVCL